MSRTSTWALALCLLVPAAGALVPPTAAAAERPGNEKKDPPPAPKDWKKEFEEICAKTQDAMSLTDDVLTTLVKRCDELKPTIDNLPETERKVYGKRLSSCRNVFSYVLESRHKG
jgi:hypothetical protein